MTEKINTTRKQNKRRKRAAAATEVAIAKAGTRLNTERMNARLRALMTKHFPVAPIPVFPATSVAAEMTMLSYIAASTPFFRRDLAWNMDKAMEEGTVTRRRVERNARLVRRLVFNGLVRRGEVKKVNAHASE